MSSAPTYGEVVNGILRKRYGSQRYGAQMLADAARATRRTAENWLAGTCAPNGQALIGLMAECEELESEIMKLVKEARCKKA